MIHLPRTAYHVGRGLWQARQAAGGIGPPAVALGLTVPHVYSGRVGLLDTDVNGHLNNAAYLVNCEMARWEWVGASGLLQHAVKEKIAFIIASTAVRFRREIKLGQRYEVSTMLSSWDERSGVIRHEFTAPGRPDDVLSQVLCKCVFKRGRETLAPEAVLRAAGAVDPASLKAAGEVEVAFDGLNEAMREAARR